MIEQPKYSQLLSDSLKRYDIMVLQQTSLEAYREIFHKLGERQKVVLNVFNRFEGNRSLTNMEVAMILGWSINRITPRVFELRERSLLKEDEKRICGITGSRAIAWKRTLRCLGDAYE